MWVRIADADDPPVLLIDVIDSGAGIPSDLLSRLFTRGARGGERDTVDGLGLGLYIVDQVMSLHGSTTEVLRTGSQGTTIRLAISQADPAP